MRSLNELYLLLQKQLEAEKSLMNGLCDLTYYMKHADIINSADANLLFRDIKRNRPAATADKQYAWQLNEEGRRGRFEFIQQRLEATKPA